ncbi:Sua5/YciO/YrdC/YwlC family protein [Streptomyces sp. SID8379]|uniref:L-threonylcarbamoyladenylate synthase n=1 Tax=unclassified Streptomyces TaxID=2593676 RepID=UPI00037F39EA|nr:MULTISPECIES: L-threonylcarbamoyladenylate synthase [unclassified Streptomyces]MYW69317.1 Sua5/YciO/YrdC/YwlC family protein [Streptomyces sp. SID8379]
MSAEIVDARDGAGLLRAGEALRAGAVVAAQTDTNYGVFCNPFLEDVCGRLYEMKRRDGGKPLTLFVSSPADWARWGRRPAGVDVDALVERFWPGPLNLVMEKREIVPDWVTSGRPTVSVVHNVSPVLNLLSLYSGLPLAATSANISGTMDEGLVTFDIAREHIGDHCDLIVRGEAPSKATRSSTIVSLLGTPAVLRQGDLPAEELAPYLPGLTP